MSRRSPLLLPLSLSSALLCVGACKNPSTKIDLQEIENGERAEDGRTGEPATRLDPLPVERPTDLLPAEVSVLLEVTDPGVVLPLFDGLQQEPELDTALREASDMLGGNPLKAEDWAKLGLDVHRPAGIALLDPRSLSIAAWFSLTDEQTFTTAMLRIAEQTGGAQELSRSEMGDAHLYRFGRSFHAIVRANTVMFVFVEQPDQAPRDYPATIATIDPRDGLARSQGFGWAREQTRAGDDGIFFVAPNPLVQAFEQEQRNDYGVTWAEDQLAEARRTGADAQTIRDLEQRLAQEQEWAREREREDKAALEAVRELVGPMRAFAITADVDRTKIDARARLLMPDGGLLRDLFVPLQSQTPLLSALDEPPLFILDGQVDPQKFLRLVDLLARTDDETLEKLDQEAASMLGFSFMSTVVPLFDGRAGFAITQIREPDPKKLDKTHEVLGMAAHAGLKDPEGTRKLLDDLARNPLLKGAIKKAKKGGWEIAVPEWKTVHLDVVDTRLIATSDRALIGRVRDAKPGKQAATLTGDHLAVGKVPTPALRMYQRWPMVLLLDPPSFWAQSVDNFLYDYEAHPSLDREQAAKVPKGKTTKAKLAELDKLIKELDAFNRRRAEREFKQQYSILQELGDVGMQLEVVGDGLTIHGRWQLGGKRSLVELFVLGLMVRSPDDDWTEYERLSTRAWELAAEIRTLRTEELNAFAAKQPAQ